MMDTLGLEACALHGSPEALMDEHSRLYDYARNLRCKYVTASLSSADFGTRFRDYAETCRKVNAVASNLGFTFAYHNHGVEFTKVDGGIAYDLFCACLDDSARLNFNVVWAQMGGVDPVGYLARYLTRTCIAHLGDCDTNRKFCDLGTGMVPLPKAMTMLDNHVAWAILDHSHEGADAELASAERCMEYLRKLSASPASPPATKG